jgi:uncharacterized membrane protein
MMTARPPTQGPPFQKPRLCIARGEWALSERALVGSDTWIGNDTWKGNGFSMASFERSIEINVPVSTAYNQWTQFEELQRFMDGVEEVRQLDDTRVHWRASIAGQEEEWNATIIDQVPDQHVAWRSTSGSENSGVIRFQPLGPNQTRVTAVIDYDPEGIVENIGDKLGFVGRRVEGALEQFKTFIEGRGAETGAWRGEIHDGAVDVNSSSPIPTTTRL